MVKQMSKPQSVLFFCVNVDLWRMYEVHLEQTCLQVSLGGAVVLQSIQEEGGALLDQAAFHEHIHNLQSTIRTRRG